MPLAIKYATQALSLLGHLNDLYGCHGIVDWSVMWQNRSPGVPDLAWLNTALNFVGAAAFSVPLAFAAYVLGLLGLLLGYRTRLAAGLAWVMHTALVNSNYMSTYGADSFAQIGLFYCLWFPVVNVVSMRQAAGCDQANDGRTNFGAWLGLRILQLHVCIFYTASGVEKALGEQWWNGEAIWRAIMGAPLDGPFDFSFLANLPWLSKTACWLTLLLEAGIVLFVWHPRLRILWLMGIVGMHLGIALILGLWTFAATMIVFDVAAFGVGCSSRIRGGSLTSS